VTNLEIEKELAKEAKCDLRTARKALEHGYMMVRRKSVRERVKLALRRRRDLGKLYSKEHYP
jgi:hypothetical protein